MKLNAEVEKIILAQDHAGTHCKSCGRYIGALELCPFCRNITPKRTVVRLIKYLTPVISVLGLFALHYIGIHYGNPQVKLETLGKRSNFAQVSVKADVTGPVRYYPAADKGEDAGGSIEFEIDDGTALMSVRCYDDATRELVENKKLPGLGDKVSLRASFQHKGKGGFLILGSQMGIDLERKTPEKATPIKTFTPGDKLKKGDRVKLSGKVNSAKDARYEYAVSLDNLSGDLATVIIPLSILQANKLVKENSAEWKNSPAAGEFLTVTGAVDMRGKKGSEYMVLLVSSLDEIVRANEETVKKDNIL